LWLSGISNTLFRRPAILWNLIPLKKHKRFWHTILLPFRY
jgi:hypothetical protein